MEDDEFVLQLLIAFYRLLQVDEPREELLQHSQIVIYLLDLLLDHNKEIKRVADLALDAVAEADEQWASQIRERKFAMHNSQWLELVDEDEAEEYQDALALNNAMQSLHLQAPLDASQLDGDDYEDGAPYSPNTEELEQAHVAMDQAHMAAYASAAGYEVGHDPSAYDPSAYNPSAYDPSTYVARDDLAGYEQGYTPGYADGYDDPGGYAEPELASYGYGMDALPGGYVYGLGAGSLAQYADADEHAGYGD